MNIRCEPDALDDMTKYTGGLPMLAHEIGDAVFSADDDSNIDYDDAFSGVLDAADVVGRRYLDPLVYKAIRSDRYRTILRQVSMGLFTARFTRAEVRSSLPEDERKVLDNFLQRMKKLGVIVEDPDGERGSYCFSNLLHHLYFFMEGQRINAE